MSNQKRISVVIPVYNEAPNLKPLYAELVHNLERLNYHFEILFVDDGSKDDSATILCEIAEQYDNVSLVQFARNFGKEAAVSAGLHAAKGDAAIILDADMQMPPSLIGEFLKKWEAGAEVPGERSEKQHFIQRT